MAKSTQSAGNITGTHDTRLQSRHETLTHYREYASQMRALADGERRVSLRKRLEAMANRYEALADDLERNPDPEPLA